MAFNHYARLKQLVENHPGWYIVRIDQPTTAVNFKGQAVHFGHYYRLYDVYGRAIPYGKFQQLERLATVLGLSVELLPLRHG